MHHVLFDECINHIVLKIFNDMLKVKSHEKYSFVTIAKIDVTSNQNITLLLVSKINLLYFSNL